SAGAGSAAATGPGSTSAAGSTPAAGSNAAPGSTPAAGTSGSVGQTRIAAAEAAIRTFLNSITNPADRTGLATFSTYYRPEVLPNRNRSDAETALDSIKRPAAEGAFTELYASLRSAAKDLAGWKGRKVIILLTDGENYPYKLHTGKPSPQFGNQVITSDQAIQSLIREGISVFPIHFGPAQEDSNLSRIARETGGRLFEASNESELAGVYLDVRSRVLKEYRLTYTPRMLTGDRRIVQVGYSGPGGPDSAKQTYFVGTLFGGVPGGLSPLLLIPLLLALAGWFLLSRLRFLNRRTQPNIELLGEGRTQVCAIAGDRTILRPAPNEAVTVVEGQGEGDAEPGDVTISKNRSTGAYTVVSSEPVMINNRPERRRDLSPGDVIRMGEVTVVFDDPEKE
ncbi:vWA domain-containing protein, partial [Salinispira pacifica]